MIKFATVSMTDGHLSLVVHTFIKYCHWGYGPSRNMELNWDWRLFMYLCGVANNSFLEITRRPGTTG